MKTVSRWIVAWATFAVAALPAGAGEIYVEIQTPDGDPKEGAEVQVTLDDGEKTEPVKTGKDGVAFLAWKTEIKKGRILVDGAAQYAGTIPLRISFKQ
jgi:hypothetical protein